MTIFRNTPYNRRRALDFVVGVVTMVAICAAGAGWWSLLIVPFGLWNYYDGATRADLSRE